MSMIKLLEILVIITVFCIMVLIGLGLVLYQQTNEQVQANKKNAESIKAVQASHLRYTVVDRKNTINTDREICDAINKIKDKNIDCDALIAKIIVFKP